MSSVELAPNRRSRLAGGISTLLGPLLLDAYPEHIDAQLLRSVWRWIDDAPNHHHLRPDRGSSTSSAPGAALSWFAVIWCRERLTCND